MEQQQRASRWAKASPELVMEILRQAEEQIKAQLQAGIASDQRAMQLVTSAATIAAGTVAAVAAIWAAAAPAWIAPLVAGTIGLVGGLSLSIRFALRAARPVAFHFPGSHPIEWSETDFTRPANITLGEQADNYQISIDDNQRMLACNAEALKWAIRFLFASPLVAAVIFAVVLAAGKV